MLKQLTYLCIIFLFSYYSSISHGKDDCSPINEIVNVNDLTSVINNTVDFEGPGWSFNQTNRSDIYLLAGARDTTKSLIKFLGGKKNARKFVGNIIDKDINYILNYPVKLKFPAVASALMDVKEHPLDYAKDLNDPNLYKLDGYTHGYNCFYSALMTAKGVDPASNWRKAVKRDGNGKVTKNPAIMGSSEFKKILDSKYQNVSAGDAVFGKTLITFGFNHVALFLGKNREGKVFILTKNGNLIAPRISTIDEFVGEEPQHNFGSPRNFTLDNVEDSKHLSNPGGKYGSGYYNPK